MEKQTHHVPLLEATVARAQGDVSRAHSLFQIARDRILVSWASDQTIHRCLRS